MLAHLYDLVRQRAVLYPDAIALGGQQGLTWKALTSQELLDLVDCLAIDLAARGVQARDRVVLWVPNHWRTPVYLFALWKLGVIVVPFDREMNPEAGVRILESVEPRCVIAGYGERPAWAREGALTEWWEPGTPQGGLEQNAAWNRPAEELAAVVFTSGTTGTPKGCVITHANLCSQVEVIADRIPLDPSCRLASILPLSHLFELTCGLLYPLASGAAIHYIPSRRGSDIVRVLSQQRVTHMIAVPQLLTMMGQALDEQVRAKLPAPIYRALHALAARLPLPARRWLFWPVHRKLGGQLRMLASGGAALSADSQLLWERLGVRVVQGYGASECSPVIACGAADGSTPMGSVGRPIRGVEVRLSAEGELLAKGHNVMRGYWKDPGRTAEVLKDGWYATGDLATMDDAGNIRLLGRAKDLIVLPSGMNVWPLDVEDVLRSHPAVKDAAVIAAPTPAGGATLHAYLIPASEPNRAADLSAIIARCNGRLAQHQRIATASWWQEVDFPRSTTLKVKRHLLPPPEAVEAVKIESVLAADDPVSQAVAGAARVRVVQPNQTLGELGMDSMGLVKLALALEEKTGKIVADGDLRLEMTVEQVRAFLAKAHDLETAPQLARRGGPRLVMAEPPLWPYTWGRILRHLAFPFDLLYRYAVKRTVVIGQDYLGDLPPRVILAGTHHSFADVPLVRHALAASAARRLSGRLAVAADAEGLGKEPLAYWIGIVLLGMYPLQKYAEQEANLRRLAQVAAAGNPILIFPQGTHAKPEQERANDPRVRFRPGVAHLAAALDAAVVPFGLAGTEVLIPPSLEGFRGPVIAGIPAKITRGPLAIAFGAPLTLQSGEAPDEFAARLQPICYALTRLAERVLHREIATTARRR